LKRLFQLLSTAIALASIIVWAATGSNRGWTKTSVPVNTLDPVTGIEGITYEKRFSPGVDFLGAGLILAGILGGISLLYKPPAPKA